AYTLMREAGCHQPRDLRGQHDFGHDAGAAARAHERDDVAKVGPRLDRRGQRTLRPYGQGSIVQITDAAMPGAERCEFAERNLPAACHSPPRKVTNYDTPKRIFSPPLKVMPGEGK